MADEEQIKPESLANGPYNPSGLQTTVIVTPPPAQTRIVIAVTVFWMWIAFIGWVIALGGLSRMQDLVTDDGRSTSSWSINANYPNLAPSHVFRFDWFTVFYELVILMVVVLANLSNALDQARLSAVGLLAVAAVLQILSADRLYNVSDFRNYTPARCAFAGFILCATADLGLIYMLGLSPAPYQL